MTSQVFGKKVFRPTPPDKGSFPLDHEGECKAEYLRYMVCLANNDHAASRCRLESKEYLGCRMDRGLMAREGWDTLGFANEAKKAAAEGDKAKT